MEQGPKGGTIFIDVFDFYDFLRRVAEIEATVKQTFIVSCSKRNIFIGSIVIVVWENCLVRKINMQEKTLRFTVERKW